jgi:hypothetical protein
VADAFLQLSPEEQADILQTLSAKLGRRVEHLEKDVWICWVLQGLFSMPGRLPMAFKCFRQLDLAPFDLLFWPHLLVNHHSAPGRSEALRRP